MVLSAPAFHTKLLQTHIHLPFVCRTVLLYYCVITQGISTEVLNRKIANAVNTCTSGRWNSSPSVLNIFSPSTIYVFYNISALYYIIGPLARERQSVGNDLYGDLWNVYCCLTFSFNVCWQNHDTKFSRPQIQSIRTDFSSCSINKNKGIWNCIYVSIKGRTPEFKFLHFLNKTAMMALHIFHQCSLKKNNCGYTFPYKTI